MTALRRPALVACAVGMLACAVYANTLGHGFAYDDPRVIVDNPAIRDVTDLRRIFTTPSWFMEGTSTTAFRPLTTWSFAANYALHGTAPLGYHLVNVGLHGLVSALVVLFASSAGMGLGTAAVAGALFAVHPVHTEVVANGVGRAELLAAAFALLALWLRRTAPHARRPALLDAASALAYAAALLSKEHTVALLVLLPLTDLLLDDDRRLRSFIARLRGRAAYYAALGAVTLGYLALRGAAVGGLVGGLDVGGRMGFGYNVIAWAPPGPRVLTVLAVQSQALWLLLWPVSLSADYSYSHLTLVTGLGDPRAIAGIGVALGLVGGIIAAWRRSPHACLWLAVALLPWVVVCNLVLSIGTIFAERLVYLPSVGACALLAMGFAAAAARLSWPVPATMTGAVLVAWSLQTAARNRIWRDDLTLAEATVEDAPRSAHAHDYLARVYAGLRRDDDALRQFAESARLLDDHPDWPERLDVLYQTAGIHMRRGDRASAAALYREIVQRAPDYFPAWINLGALENVQGHHAAALDAADRAVALRPDVPNAYVVRGTALRGLARPADALAAFEAALARAPDASDALLGLGAAAFDLREFERAGRAFERLVQTAPSPDAYRGLAMSLQGLGRADDARRVRERARSLYPSVAEGPTS